MITDDPRFIHIGDLPSGSFPYEDPIYKEIFVRYITIQEMFTLHMGMTLRDVRHIIRGVQLCVGVDVGELTDGDFYYIMAWLRIHSFPKAPVTTEWRCLNQVYKNPENKDVYRGMSRNRPANYIHEPCSILNTQLVHNPILEVHTLEDDYVGLPYEDVDFPKVKTLVDYTDKVKEFPDLQEYYQIARWVKEGDTLGDKVIILEEQGLELFERISEVSNSFVHGISETLPLKCRVCGYSTNYKLDANVFNFFADNTEQKILDMQYSLQQAFGMTPDNNMLAKQLLYFYSCLAKDIKEQEEVRRINKNSKGSGTTNIMGKGR